MERIVVIGAGGHAREVWDIAQLLAIDVVGFLADDLPTGTAVGDRGECLGSIERLDDLAPDVRHVIAIGDGHARSRIDSWAVQRGRRAITLVHPTAVVGHHAVELGEGTTVCAGAQLTTDLTLGRHVLVNRGAQVGHDAIIGDYASLHPGSIVSGGARLGSGVMIGTLGCVLPRVQIGEWATVGAGAVVADDLPAGSTAVGIPAKPIDRINRRSET